MGNRKEEIGRKCPFCGAVVADGEFFCRSCHKRFTDQGLDAPSSSGLADTYVVAVRKSYISALLSATGAGLGQLYNGDTLTGLAFFIGYIVVSFNVVTTQYQTILLTVIWIAAIAEALWSASRINRYERPFYGVSRLLYLLLALLALIVALHVLTGEPSMSYLARVFPLVHLWMG
jgi:TM2 domain-containing membrane protein YozV